MKSNLKLQWSLVFRWTTFSAQRTAGSQKAKCPPASAVAQRPAEVAITGELHNLSDRQLDRLMGYIQALKELPDSTTPQNVAIAEKNASEENSSAAG